MMLVAVTLQYEFRFIAVGSRAFLFTIALLVCGTNP